MNFNYKINYAHGLKLDILHRLWYASGRLACQSEAAAYLHSYLALLRQAGLPSLVLALLRQAGRLAFLSEAAEGMERLFEYVCACANYE